MAPCSPLRSVFTRRPSRLICWMKFTFASTRASEIVETIRVITLSCILYTYIGTIQLSYLALSWALACFCSTVPKEVLSVILTKNVYNLRLSGFLGLDHDAQRNCPKQSNCKNESPKHYNNYRRYGNYVTHMTVILFCCQGATQVS